MAKQKIRLLEKERSNLRIKFLSSSVQRLLDDTEITVITEREWRKLVGMNNAIPEFDPIQSLNKERVRKSILSNLPDSLRGEIWCMICQVKRERNSHAPGFY